MTSKLDGVQLPNRTKLDTLTDVVVAVASISVSFAVMVGYRLPGSSWWSALAVLSLSLFQGWRTLAIDTDVVLTKWHWRKITFAAAGGLSSWAYASLLFPEGVSRLLAVIYH